MPPREREPRRTTVTALAGLCGLAVTSLAAGAQPHDAATVPLALPGIPAHPPMPQRYPLPTNDQDDEPRAGIAMSSIGARLNRLTERAAGNAQQQGVALDDGTIPQQVLTAYRRAANVMRSRDEACQLHWSVLAGIGRIESGHARGGALLDDGRTASPILGPRLDGSLAGTATIHDSTGGQFDGDTVWERAVGPMQFLPSTWLRYGQDGNDDGVRDPHNIHDATLGSAVYLCAGARDLPEPSHLNQALFSYNPSSEYVRAVLAWADHYAGLGPRPGAGRTVTHTLAASRGPEDAVTKPGEPKKSGDNPAAQQEPPKPAASKTPTNSPDQSSNAGNEERPGNTDGSSTPDRSEDTKKPGPTDESPSAPNGDGGTGQDGPGTTEPIEPAEPSDPADPDDSADPSEPEEPDDTDPTEPGETDPSCEEPDNTGNTDDESTDSTNSEERSGESAGTTEDSGRSADDAPDDTDADDRDADDTDAGDTGSDESADGTEQGGGTACEQPPDGSENGDTTEPEPTEPEPSTEPQATTSVQPG